MEPNDRTAKLQGEEALVASAKIGQEPREAAVAAHDRQTAAMDRTAENILNLLAQAENLLTSK